MDPMYIVNLMKSPDPMNAAQQLFSYHPAWQQAQRMANMGQDQIKSMVFDVANRKGISREKLNEIAKQFGVTL